MKVAVLLTLAAEAAAYSSFSSYRTPSFSSYRTPSFGSSFSSYRTPSFTSSLFRTPPSRLTPINNLLTSVYRTPTISYRPPPSPPRYTPRPTYPIPTQCEPVKLGGLYGVSIVSDYSMTQNSFTQGCRQGMILKKGEACYLKCAPGYTQTGGTRRNFRCSHSVNTSLRTKYADGPDMKCTKTAPTPKPTPKPTLPACTRPNEILKACGVPCQDYCGRNPLPCPKFCKVNQCECKPGYIRSTNDSTSSTCIPTSQCPTKAPTPVPTTAAPTPVPTTAAPTTAAPTPKPTIIYTQCDDTWTQAKCTKKAAKCTTSKKVAAKCPDTCGVCSTFCQNKKSDKWCDKREKKGKCKKGGFKKKCPTFCGLCRP